MSKADKFENVDKISSFCTNCGETRSDPVIGKIQVFGSQFPVADIPEDLTCCTAPRYKYCDRE